MGRADSPLKGRVIFVVGARRSGTNWLQRILSAHPDVAAMPSETYLFSHGVRALAERFQHTTPGTLQTGLTFMDRDVFLDAARDFTDRVFEERLRSVQPPATYLVERTPWHVYHLDLIADLYPDAPVVHIVRDGRDVTRSLLSKEWGPDTMTAAAEEWRSSVAAGRRAGASLLPRYLEVRYEDLFTEPEDGIRSLFERLGLPSAPNALERAAIEARTAFNVDPMSAQIGTGKWRADLSTEELRAFDRIAGPLMEELGYQSEQPVAARRGETLARVVTDLGARARGARGPGVFMSALFDQALRRRSAAALQRTVVLAQRLEEQLARGRDAALEDLLRDDALVEIVDDGSAERSRGRLGVERLRESLASHRDRGLRPVTGRVEVSHTMFTVVGTYRLDDGTLWARTLVVTLHGQRVSRLIFHRHRLASTHDADHM